ncbi:MAG: small multi-drug export protein [Candidatus Altiarchaeota archaeon]
MASFYDWLQVVFLAVLPWLELRGAIPYGIVRGLDPVLVFIVATTANVAIIYPLFKFLDWFFFLLNKLPFMDRIISRVQNKAKPYVDKYGFMGLAFFVGVPLPGTGAYSGALAAHVLGIKNRKGLLSIILGVVFAGVVITLLSTVFKGTVDWLLKY